VFLSLVYRFHQMFFNAVRSTSFISTDRYNIEFCWYQNRYCPQKRARVYPVRIALVVWRRRRAGTGRCPERLGLAYAPDYPVVLAEFLLVVNFRPEIAFEMLCFDHRQCDVRLN